MSIIPDVYKGRNTKKGLNSSEKHSSMLNYRVLVLQNKNILQHKGTMH